MLTDSFDAVLHGTFDLKQMRTRFPDDAAWLKALMVQSFGGTEITCPGCNRTTRFHAMTKRRAYACQQCGYHIYPCAGTMLHGSRTPLSKMLFAVHLLASNGTVSPAELERTVGFSYKTARRITNAFRSATSSKLKVGGIFG